MKPTKKQPPNKESEQPSDPTASQERIDRNVVFELIKQDLLTMLAGKILPRKFLKKFRKAAKHAKVKTQTKP